jgi:hypothetical protein
MNLTIRQLRVLELALILAISSWEEINDNIIEDDEDEVTPEELIELHEIINGLAPRG